MDVPAAARGVYGIAVAAELVGMGVQALRMYERRGLLEPVRTDGGTRRYSEQDLTRLRRIGELLDAGLNLAGIARVLDLETDNAELLADNTQLREEKEEHQWLSTARTRQPRSPRPTSSSNEHPPTPSSTRSSGTRTPPR